MSTQSRRTRLSRSFIIGGVFLSVFIVTFILWYFCELPFQTCSENHTGKVSKRSMVTPSKDVHVKYYGGLELNYMLGATTTFQFDLCEVIDCGQNPTVWRGYDVYLCGSPIIQADCAKGRPVCSFMHCHSLCEGWEHVLAYTGRWTPTYTYGYQDTAKQISLVRNALTHNTPGGVNPLFLSMKSLSRGLHAQLYSGGTVIYFILEVEVSGTHPNKS
ncbi:hypothetical protein XENOCAPTIV_028902 [Xenoophorus captivus]|uniref:Uncharacterized protein n=1 Tax=Xenoophorus captivus TaxID=1517983 RepID=A0ABV0SK16_9TELE